MVVLEQDKKEMIEFLEYAKDFNRRSYFADIYIQKIDNKFVLHNSKYYKFVDTELVYALIQYQLLTYVQEKYFFNFEIENYMNIFD